MVNVPPLRDRRSSLGRRIGLVLALTLAGASAGAAEPPRLALVIGNSVYPAQPALRACAASASVVTAALKRAGFEVTTLLNVTNGRMGAAIVDFGDAITREPGGVALIYVCGYAVAFDGRVFLLPASATLERETDAMTQGVVGRLVVNTVVGSEAKAGLVLLDSAALPGRNAPLPLASLVNPANLGGKGFAAVHSTIPPPDGATPLAAAFVAGIAPPQVEARALLADVRDAVQVTTGVTSLVLDPTQPAWLKGAPPRAAPPAAPVPTAAAAPAAPAPRHGAEPAALDEADRRRVQLALQRLGYYAGKVDGALGGETQGAIRRYQRESNAEATGRLTGEQADRLLLDGR